MNSKKGIAVPTLLGLIVGFGGFVVFVIWGWPALTGAGASINEVSSECGLQNPNQICALLSAEALKLDPDGKKCPEIDQGPIALKRQTISKNCPLPMDSSEIDDDHPEIKLNEATGFFDDDAEIEKFKTLRKTRQAEYKALQKLESDASMSRAFGRCCKK